MTERVTEMFMEASKANTDSPLISQFQSKLGSQDKTAMLLDKCK